MFSHLSFLSSTSPVYIKGKSQTVSHLCINVTYIPKGVVSKDLDTHLGIHHGSGPNQQQKNKTKQNLLSPTDFPVHID